MLVREGYEVQDAQHGRQALDIYRRWSADVVLTDLIMPEMEGFETIMALKKIKPDVKVIAMSGGGRIGPAKYLGLAEKLGAAKTLEKPFEFRKLAKALSDLLGTTPAPSLVPVPTTPTEPRHGKSPRDSDSLSRRDQVVREWFFAVFSASHQCLAPSLAGRDFVEP